MYLTPLSGKAFDALIVDPNANDSPFDITESDNTMDVLQKFLLLGDDRSFSDIYVNGRKVV